MSPATAQRYFAVFIDTLARLLKYFPRFNIYVEDIRNMLRSITEPNAPLPRQKVAVEVDFRASPVPGGERSDSDEPIPPLAAEQDGARAHSSEPDLDQSMSSHTLFNPSFSNKQSLQTPTDDKTLLWPYLGTADYDLDLISDPSHGLLWDWADALGPSIPR